MEWIHRRLLAGGGRIGNAVATGLSGISPTHYPQETPYRRLVEEQRDRGVQHGLRAEASCSTSSSSLFSNSESGSTQQPFRGATAKMTCQRVPMSSHRQRVVYSATKTTCEKTSPLHDYYDDKEEADELWELSLISTSSLPCNGTRGPLMQKQQYPKYSPNRRGSQQMGLHVSSTMRPVQYRCNCQPNGHSKNGSSKNRRTFTMALSHMRGVNLCRCEVPDERAAEKVHWHKTGVGITPCCSSAAISHLPRQSHPVQVVRGIFDRAKGSSTAEKRKGVAIKRHAKRSISPSNPVRPTSNGDRSCAFPCKFEMLLHLPHSRTLAEAHSWSPDDRSRNIYIKEEDRLTLHRQPVAQSTDAIRGKVGYLQGFHVWEIVWPSNQRGTHPVVGVATKAALLQRAGYSSLLGTDEESYGWDLDRNVCSHDSRHQDSWPYPAADAHDEDFHAPDRFYCILDMDEGTLAFATPTQYLGVAFRNLRKNRKLYPAISAVWGHCEITLRYIGGLDPEPRQLMDICRKCIRNEVGSVDRIEELSLPPVLLRYLLHNR